MKTVPQPHIEAVLLHAGVEGSHRCRQLSLEMDVPSRLSTQADTVLRHIKTVYNTTSPRVEELKTAEDDYILAKTQEQSTMSNLRPGWPVTLLT